jgi:Flp pilus assembly protein TadG
MTRHRRNERGSALVEFALSFSLLFTMFAGVFQFGYAHYVYNALEGAVRGGARYASVRVYDSATATPSSAYLTAVKNMVVYGSPSGGDRAVAPGLTPEKVNISVTMDRNVPARITVRISNYTINSVIHSFVLADKPRVTFPFMGRFAP